MVCVIQVAADDDDNSINNNSNEKTEMPLQNGVGSTVDKVEKLRKRKSLFFCCCSGDCSATTAVAAAANKYNIRKEMCLVIA